MFGLKDYLFAQRRDEVHFFLKGLSSLSPKVSEINSLLWHTGQSSGSDRLLLRKGSSQQPASIFSYEFKPPGESNAALAIITCVSSVRDAVTADDLAVYVQGVYHSVV